LPLSAASCGCAGCHVLSGVVPSGGFVYAAGADSLYSGAEAGAAGFTYFGPTLHPLSNTAAHEAAHTRLFAPAKPDVLAVVSSNVFLLFIPIFIGPAFIAPSPE
jgi:hypothetical protein